MAAWCSTLRPYRSYVLFILVPYVVLIALFHTQLQGGTQHHQRLEDKIGVTRVQEDTSFAKQDTFRLRELQLQGVVAAGDHEVDAAAGSPVKSHNTMVILNKPISYLGEGILNASAIKLLPKQHMSSTLHARNDKDMHGIVKNIKISRDSAQMKDAYPPRMSLIDKAYKDLGDKLANSTLLQSLADGVGGPDPVVREGPGFPVQSHCRHSQTVLESSGHFHPMQGNYIYSAYYDDRRSDTPRVMLIALLKKNSKPAMFCHFRATGTKSRRFYSSPITDYYEMCENHAKDFGGWMLSCDIPSQLQGRPCEVTMSLHSNPKRRKTTSVLLPVFTLHASWEHKRNFGVCVPPLFGYIPSTTLIEFVELTQLLGASHLVVYLQQVSREVRKVLRYYQHLGVLTVLPWELPVPDRSIWYHGQLLAINDCLHRGMHGFKYLAFNDIDEFVVPHGGASNWTSMVESIQGHPLSQQDSQPGMTFQSAFFDPLMTVGASRALYDLESDLRTKSFSRVRTKVMVDPAHIYELGIHHISKPLNESKQPHFVQPEAAFIHHYRKCVTDFDPKMNCQVFARDESLSDYIPTLRHNVHQTLWILKEIDKYFPDHQHYYR